MPQNFLLTRVTRIFEKPIFTKTALAGAHGTPLQAYSFADTRAPPRPGASWHNLQLQETVPGPVFIVSD